MSYHLCKICETCSKPLEGPAPTYWRLVRVMNPYVLEEHYCGECAPLTQQDNRYTSEEDATLALITYKLTR